MSRVTPEKVKEVIRDAVEQAEGDNSIITISSGSSVYDSSFCTYADDTSAIVYADVSSNSVFDESNMDEKNRSQATASVTDDNDATVFNFEKKHVRQVKDAVNISGKRFERQTGAKCAKNYDIDFRPVANAELEAADLHLESVYSCKKVASFGENEVEIFCDEVLRVQNTEAVFTDVYCQVYFSLDDLTSQTIFNEESLEVSPLDTVANYRTRIQDALIAYLAARYKWESYKKGPFAQNLPSFVPGRDFISNSRADLLKIPYTEGEAKVRFQKMIEKLDEAWLGNQDKLDEQMSAVLDILRTGAYSLPRPVLENETLEIHLQDVMKKDLLKCCRDIRKGMTFTSPAKRIQLVLNEYVRVSTDFLPYAFFCLTKTSVLAVTQAAENPMSTIRLNCYDGSKFYKKFNFHSQILESPFTSLYFGLHTMRLNSPAQIPTALVRNGDIPDFQVTQAVNHINGLVSVMSPPPHHLQEVLPGTPVPKVIPHVATAADTLIQGKAGFWLVKLDDLAKKEVTFVDANMVPTGMKRDGVPMNRVGVALKRKNEVQD